jgi:hypothetical protein
MTSLYARAGGISFVYENRFWLTWGYERLPPDCLINPEAANRQTDRIHHKSGMTVRISNVPQIDAFRVKKRAGHRNRCFRDGR